MNGKYSQQDLLLLSNFVYIPVCLSDKSIEEIIDAYREPDGSFTEESVAAAAAGGGMSTKDVCTVFTEMDKGIERNPDLGKLSAVRTLEEHDVRALCYTDPKDENAVVAFRGTGGTVEAWTDNFEGAYESDTRIQKIASEFIEYECAAYEDIVVTGHSKGGNLAQYVTVKQPDRVGECVSYDGQGFGDSFLMENPSGIKNAAPKITSVSAYNDFVNILLTTIAGTSIFIANDPSAAGAHSSVTLLTENEFDENGAITSVRKQGLVAGELHRLTDMMCDRLSHAGRSDKESLSEIAGSAISCALTTPDGMINGCLAPTAGLVAAKLAQKYAQASKAVKRIMPLAANSVSVEADKCRSAAESIKEQSEMIGTMTARVDNVKNDLAYSINSGVFCASALDGVCERMRKVSTALNDYSAFINTVITRYEMCEAEALSIISQLPR
ncbi:MAG: DUF2974 domain-containing protein [Lachnospiraceae bacterium]|nr:DUF2974 domain-containing protein [Lachnospiraceae bacterium]